MTSSNAIFSVLSGWNYKVFVLSLERYFHVVLKTDLNISFSTTQSVVIAKKLECEVTSWYLYILISETPYVLSSTLRPNLAKQIHGQAEVVDCLQPLKRSKI